MKKTLHVSVLFALCTVVLLVAPQVMALEMRVNQNGQMYFYNDGVLGENSVTQAQPTAIQPMRTVSPTSGQNVQIRSAGDKTQVELRERSSGQATTNFVNTEQVDTDRLRLQYPASLTDQQVEIAKQRTMRQLDAVKTQASNLSATEKQRVESTIEARKQRSEEYLQKVYEARQTRERETVELRSRQENGEEVLELQSREVKARIKQGATFTLDPETNLVTVTTPSGQEHVLNHLPDQAISRMVEVGVISDSALVENTPEIDVEPADDGQVVYRTRVQVKQKLFGLFNRSVETEVELDDTTGTVTQTELPSDTFFGQVLDVFTF